MVILGEPEVENTIHIEIKVIRAPHTVGGIGEPPHAEETRRTKKE